MTAPLLHPGAACTALGLALLLSGCASFSSDGGFAPVEQAARRHLQQQAVWARSPDERRTLETRIAELLAAPLSADAAVQLALLNHRGLQAAFFELGIAEAEVVQASRIGNPVLSIGRFVRGEERELERSLHLGLAGLLAMPAARRAADARFAQVQREATLAMLTLAFDTRRAWVQAVAAGESLAYALQVQEAADAGAELAKRMAAVGNWNALNLAREQRFAADAALGVAHARRGRLAARERLTRLLGLWGEQTAFTLPERLPELPAELPDSPDIEQQAMATRLDVQAARLDAEARAAQLGLTGAARFVDGLELGVASKRSNEAPTQRGIELGIALPIFDTGAARAARADAMFQQALNRAASTAIDARSQVREATLGWRLAHDIARQHRDALVPLAQRIADEQLLRYNGMLIGVFELLADARERIGAVNASLAAQRDFWLADADLRMAMFGRTSPGSAVDTPLAVPAPAAAGH